MYTPFDDQSDDLAEDWGFEDRYFHITNMSFLPYEPDCCEYHVVEDPDELEPACSRRDELAFKVNVCLHE